MSDAKHLFAAMNPLVVERQDSPGYFLSRNPQDGTDEWAVPSPYIRMFGRIEEVELLRLNHASIVREVDMDFRIEDRRTLTAPALAA